MMDQPTGPIARETLSDRGDALTVRLDVYAGGIADRLESFGVSRGVGDSPLLDAVTRRWTLPEHLDGGLELFDLDAFAVWGADWTVRAGYEDILYDAPGADYVIPVDVVSVDPDLASNVTARSARRSPRASAARLRPVRAPGATRPRRDVRSATERPLVRASAAPGAGSTTPESATTATAEADVLSLERAAAAAGLAQGGGAREARGPERTPPLAVLSRAAVARERYRAAGPDRLTPYPAAMGRAGALDASMLRFPTARARLTGDRPAIIEASPSVDLTVDGRGFARAARGAERGVQALVDRLVPGAPAPLSGWLVPIDGAASARVPPPVGSASPNARASRPGLGDALTATTPGEARLDIALPPMTRRLGRWQSLAAGRAFAVPTSAATPGLLGLAARVDALAQTVFDRVDGTTPRLGATRPFSLEQPGVLVEPTATSFAQSEPRGAARAGGQRVERSARDPEAREVAAAASAGADDTRPSQTRAGSAEGGALARPGSVLSRRELATAALASDASTGRAFIPPRRGAAARDGVPIGPGQYAGPRGRRGGIAHVISERLARPAVEPRLTASALLLDALIGAEAPGDSSGALPRGPVFVAGQSAARFIEAAVGTAVGRFADRLAVGVGGEPGAAAAWPLMPSGALVRPFAARQVASPEPASPARASITSRAAASAVEAPGRAATHVTKSAPALSPSEVAAAARAPTPPPEPSSDPRPEPTLPSAVAASEPPQGDAGAQTLASRVSAVEALQTAWRAGPAGDVARAAVALASQVGTRLEAMIGARDPITTGVVDRLTAALTRGPRPALLDALEQFESADDAMTGAQVWSRISQLADLGPDAPTLVRPVLDSAEIGNGALATAVAEVRRTGERQQAEQRRAEQQAEQQRAEQQRVEQPRAEQQHDSRAARRFDRARAEQAAFAVVARRMGRLTTQSQRSLSISNLAAWSAALPPDTASAHRGTGGMSGPRLAGWVLDPRGQTWIRPRAELTRPSAAVRMSSPGGRSEALASQIVDGLGPVREPRSGAPRTFEFADMLASEVPGYVIRAGEAATDHAPVGGSARLDTAQRASESTSMVEAARLIERADRFARAVGRPGTVGRTTLDIADALAARPAALRGRSRGAVARRAGGMPGEPGALVASRAGARAEGERSARVGSTPAVGESAATTIGTRSSGRRRAIVSSMDAAALVESDALIASEARMPDRLARWWRAATAPTADGEGAEAAFAEAGAARVVVSPFDQSRRVSAAELEGPAPVRRSTSVAALSVYEQVTAQVRGGARAAVVGRMTSPADLGELFEPSTPSSASEPLVGRLFGDRGPQALTTPGRPRVLVETGSHAAGGPMRSAAGETPGRSAETNEQSRHRLAERMEGDLSPEEIEEIAEEVIEMLRREVEFDMARLGEDEWD